VLSLADACALVAARGQLMSALPAGGAMIAIEATEDEVTPFLVGEVSLAAVNGPSSVVISGAEPAVAAVAARFEGRRTRRLRVSHAFHSPLIEPMLAQFRQVAAGLSYADPVIGVVSNVTGTRPAAGVLQDPEYWVRQVREPVRFGSGIAALRAFGVGWFAEGGPGRALSGLVATAAGNDRVVAVPLLDQGAGEERGLAGGLARLHVAGSDVAWAAFFAGTDARRVELPTYAFARERFWPRPGAGAGNTNGTGHPMLGAAVELADSGEVVLSGRLSLEAQPWIGDHKLGGMVLLPGTGFLELAMRAAEQVGGGRVAELTLTAPMLMTADDVIDVQVRVAAASEAGTRRLRVFGRPKGADGESWTEHASGLVAPGPGAAPESAGESDEGRMAA